MPVNKDNKIEKAMKSHPLLPTSDDEQEFSFDKDDVRKHTDQNSNAEPTKTFAPDVNKPNVPPRSKLKSAVNKILKEESTPKKVQIQKQNSLCANSVRWFYKEDVAASKWVPFNGWESLDIETEYQAIQAKNQESKKIHVLNRLYEVNIAEKKCSPIYWEG
jgi:hypothetical protein